MTDDKKMSLFSENTKDIEQPLNQAIRHLSYQPRTVYEMREFIKKKGYGKNTVEKVIEFLIEKKYLDDAAFAKLFVESKIRHKAKSKFAFRYELKKKGLAPAIIDTVLEPYNDPALALKAIRCKTKSWEQFDDEQIKKKMMNFLRYRGFNYDVSISTLEQFMADKNKRKGRKHGN